MYTAVSLNRIWPHCGCTCAQTVGLVCLGVQCLLCLVISAVINHPVSSSHLLASLTSTPVPNSLITSLRIHRPSSSNHLPDHNVLPASSLHPSFWPASFGIADWSPVAKLCLELLTKQTRDCFQDLCLCVHNCNWSIACLTNPSAASVQPGCFCSL